MLDSIHKRYYYQIRFHEIYLIFWWLTHWVPVVLCCVVSGNLKNGSWQTRNSRHGNWGHNRVVSAHCLAIQYSRVEFNLVPSVLYPRFSTFNWLAPDSTGIAWFSNGKNYVMLNENVRFHLSWILNPLLSVKCIHLCNVNSNYDVVFPLFPPLRGGLAPGNTRVFPGRPLVT